MNNTHPLWKLLSEFYQRRALVKMLCNYCTFSRKCYVKIVLINNLRTFLNENLCYQSLKKKIEDEMSYQTKQVKVVQDSKLNPTYYFGPWPTLSRIFAPFWHYLQVQSKDESFLSSTPVVLSPTSDVHQIISTSSKFPTLTLIVDHICVSYIALIYCCIFRRSTGTRSEDPQSFNPLPKQTRNCSSYS